MVQSSNVPNEIALVSWGESEFGKRVEGSAGVLGFGYMNWIYIY